MRKTTHRLARRMESHAISALIALGIAVIYLPLALTFYAGSFDETIIAFPPRGFTYRWFLVAIPNFAGPFLVSFQIALVVVALSLLLGVPAGIALSRYEFRGKEAVSTLLLSPLTIPTITIGLSIFLMAILIQASSGLQLRGTYVLLIVGHVLITVPWVVRLCVASLINQDRSIEDAAASLGAPPLKVIFRITIPAMRSGIVAAALFCFIISFEAVEISLFLVSPGQLTLPIATMNYLEFRVDPLVSALAAVQIVFLGIALLVMDRFVSLGRTIR